MASFTSVESFWSVYSHMKRASKLPVGCDVHMFESGIRPMWEDPANKAGGKWLIRLKKGVLQILWERLIVSIIAGDFRAVGLSPDEITGCVASLRHGEDVISIWNRTSSNPEVSESIKQKFIDVLKIPKDTILEYREHDASIAHSARIEVHDS